MGEPVKHHIQVPHNVGAGDSGAHDTDCKRRKSFNVMPGYGDNKVVFTCVDVETAFPYQWDRSEGTFSIVTTMEPMSPEPPVT